LDCYVNIKKNTTGTPHRTEIFPKSLFFSIMMDKQQAELIQLRFGLTLKLILEENKSKAIDNPKKDIIDSYGKLEMSSGLRKATLIDFALGKSNPSGTTIAAILEALEMSLSEFGLVYDKITEREILEYKKDIEKSRKERDSAKKERKPASTKKRPHK
jgi:transcriptional regulator with XRE-family HTH domain